MTLTFEYENKTACEPEFALVSAPAVEKPDGPCKAKDGQLVFIGNPTARSIGNKVWVGWCKWGEELDLLEAVQLGTPHRIMILAADVASYDDVQKLKASMANCHHYGHWYLKTGEVARGIDAINKRIGDFEVLLKAKVTDAGKAS